MKPSRDQLANRLRYATTAQCAAFYGVHNSTMTEWIAEFGLKPQPIPLDDKILILKLYYLEGMAPRLILQKFKEEITILDTTMIQSIVKPRDDKIKQSLKTYDEALQYHIAQHLKKEEANEY